MIIRMSLASRFVLLSFFPYFLALAQLPTAPPNLPSDDRYKADILLIVAHPDDDSLPAPYSAKAIDEEHTHGSVSYGIPRTGRSTPRPHCHQQLRRRSASVAAEKDLLLLRRHSFRIP